MAQPIIDRVLALLIGGALRTFAESFAAATSSRSQLPGAY